MLVGLAVWSSRVEFLKAGLNEINSKVNLKMQEMDTRMKLLGDLGSQLKGTWQDKMSRIKGE